LHKKIGKKFNKTLSGQARKENIRNIFFTTSITITEPFQKRKGGNIQRVLNS